MNRNQQRIRSRQQSQYDRLDSRQLLASLVVSTTADVIDPSDGLLSLREAVIESNTNK